MAPSEAVRTKAACYLADGRLRITYADRQRVDASCRGSAPDPYLLTWRPWRGWRCNCPAWTADCCHVTAARLVVSVAELEDGGEPLLPPLPPPPVEAEVAA